jgi:hypothetical protein
MPYLILIFLTFQFVGMWGVWKIQQTCNISSTTFIISSGELLTFWDSKPMSVIKFYTLGCTNFTCQSTSLQVSATIILNLVIFYRDGQGLKEMIGIVFILSLGEFHFSSIVLLSLSPLDINYSRSSGCRGCWTCRCSPTISMPHSS